MTYIEMSARLLMYDIFKNKAVGKEAQNLLTNVINDIQSIKN